MTNAPSWRRHREACLMFTATVAKGQRSEGAKRTSGIGSKEAERYSIEITFALEPRSEEKAGHKKEIWLNRT